MTPLNGDVVIEAMEQISGYGVGSLALNERVEPWPSTREQPVCELPASFDFREVTGWTKTAEIRQQDKFCLQTVACCKLLLDRAGALPDDTRRRGVLLGSAYGSADSESRHMEQLIAGGPGNASPCTFRNAVSNAVLGHLAVAFRFGGPSSLVLSGEVSGLYALGLARQQLRTGQCDVVITGATDLGSNIVKRRFLSYVAAGNAPAMPLMDGSCLMLLRHGRPSESGQWIVAGLALGRMSRAQDRQTLEMTLSRALGKVGLRSDEVELALVHTTVGARFCAGFAIVDQCLAILGDPQWVNRRSPGASALPLMLNVCLALNSIQRGIMPVLIGAKPNGLVGTTSTVRRLVVVAVDPSGALAVAVFVHT